MSLKKTVSTLIAASIVSTHAFGGTEVEFPLFDSELAAQNVGAIYTAQDFTRLAAMVRAEAKRIEDQSFLTLKDGKPNAKIQNLAKSINEQVDLLTAKSNNVAAASQNFLALKSLLYAVRSKLAGTQLSGGKAGAIGRILGNMTFTMPYSSNVNKVLTVQEAALEAENLVDASGKEYVRASELAGKTIAEIAQMDVREDNSFWLSRKELAEINAQYGSNWARLEQTIEKDIQEKLKDKNFTIEKARRVLEFDAIKTSATSPKVEVKDVFGLSWKLKWGEEVHSEPIANRLYVNLGGKNADLVYANRGGAKDLVLVLNKAGSDAADCSKISTVAKLKECLLNSKYLFNLDPYILETGTISENSFLDSKSALSEISAEKRAKLVGREYLVFSESMVELKSPEAAGLGAISMNVGGAVSDRAKRGFAIFSYWLQNKDSKDDNNAGVITHGEFIEYVHDLGASLSDLFTSANANEIETSFGVVAQGTGRNKGEVLKISRPVLYLPAAYESATMADAMWMAEQIGSLTQEDIRAAVEASKWPSFMVDVMTNRLTLRRNSIVEIFGVGQTISLSKSSEKHMVSLNTRDERKKAAAQIGLDVKTKGDLDAAAQIIEKYMVLDGAKIDKNGNTSYADQIVDINKGEFEVSTCRESVLVAALEATVRPTGLGRRIARKNDNKGLPECYPGLRR